MPSPFRGTNKFQEACWAWRRLPVPVIAAVDGHCYGGGLQLALAADFRFATPESEWSVLEARWGLIPDMSGIQALKELVGIDTAKRLTMTAQMLSGKEARDLGLVTELAADPEARPSPGRIVRTLERAQARLLATAGAYPRAEVSVSRWRVVLAGLGLAALGLWTRARRGRSGDSGPTNTAEGE